MISPLPDDIPLGAVISLTNRGRFIFLNDRLRPLNLSAGQFPVLMLLARRQNIMQETLVRHYHINKGTIARAVKKLEAGGYIRRIVDPANRRAVRLFLTDKGEEVVPLLQAIDCEWEDRICAGFSGEDRTTMNALMRHIAQNSHLFMLNSGDISRAEE